VKCAGMRSEIYVLLAAGLVLMAPGCGGCRNQDKPKPEEEKPKEKPKALIEISRLSTALVKPPAPDWRKQRGHSDSSEK